MLRLLPIRSVLILGVLLAAPLLATAATTYYISPTGDDDNSGRSAANPWQTFQYAIPQLKPGDTLSLADGTYDYWTTGLPSINCAIDANNGTSNAPITIRAANERRAFLQSDGSGPAFFMGNCSFWIIDGLRTESMDNPCCSENDVFTLDRDQDIIARRLLSAHNNRFTNSHTFLIYLSTRILIEESEAYFFHRHGFDASASSFVTYRRIYANSRGYPDLRAGDPMYPSGRPAPVNGYPSHPATENMGDEGISQYTSIDGIAENTISEGNEMYGSYGERNRWYGNISLGNKWGFLVTPYPECCESEDNLFVNNVAVNSLFHGFLVLSGINLVVDHLTSIRNGLYGFLMNNQWNNDPYMDLGPIVPSVSVRHSLLAYNGATGMEINNAPDFAFRNLQSINAFGNQDADFAEGTETRTSDTTLDPKLGSCIAWIPRGSPMKGGAPDGQDIGANIVYRYQNGVLTTEPLWNPTTGEFPHGAIVSGVNDMPGASLFDVHRRLNVNSGGCAFPWLSATQPTSLSIDRQTVSSASNDCYTMTVGNATNETLDIQYTFNGGPVQTITGWPTLSKGQASPCTTNGATPVGTYVFTGIRFSKEPTASYIPVSVTIVVR